MNRLNSSSLLLDHIAGSEVDFSSHGLGIVHFGVGAFHRAHQAVYTHDVLEKHGGDWRIFGVSLQSTHAADQLNAQDGMYTLAIRGGGETSYRIIKSIAHVEAASQGKKRIYEMLAAPRTRIVSMTVTEKAYGIVRDTGRVDPAHPAIKHDLENPEDPIGILGFLVKGLKERKELGLKPYTVLCCDNLPQNGDLVQSGILDFVNRLGEPELIDWIEAHGAFPNTMVDRITPAMQPELLKEVSSVIGHNDTMPVETEPFSQWVIEDHFSDGRPQWEEAGVSFTKDVAPYEEMKLRMLNGAHSLIAYVGFLCGKKYVRDVMADERMARLVDEHILAAAKTLKPLGNIDLDAYRRELIERFRNPSIAHETFQIAMDGSQKMPQRIFAPAADALSRGLSIEPFAFATATWIRFCAGIHENGERYDIIDPRGEELVSTFKCGKQSTLTICEAFFEIPDLFPAVLANDSIWKAETAKWLDMFICEGVLTVLQHATD